MANQIITTSFKAISTFGINAKGEEVKLEVEGDLNKFFDLVIPEVLFTSGRLEGKIGSLLCSHYCRWPETLLAQAEFIEGCFTPEEFKKDPRLVLGYHPNSVTSYHWSKQVKGEIIISTKLVEYEEQTLTFQRPVGTPLPTGRKTKFKALVRFWESFKKDALGNGLTPEQAFQALEQRWINGEIGLGRYSAFIFSYLYSAVGGEFIGLGPNGAASNNCPEYGEFCEVYANEIIVLRNEEGFFRAEQLPIIHLEEEDEENYFDEDAEPEEFSPGWYVQKNDAKLGYWKAESLVKFLQTNICEDEILGVQVVTLANYKMQNWMTYLGFYPAQWINTDPEFQMVYSLNFPLYREVDEECQAWIVEEDYPEAGYLKAIRLPRNTQRY